MPMRPWANGVALKFLCYLNLNIQNCVDNVPTYCTIKLWESCALLQFCPVKQHLDSHCFKMRGRGLCYIYSGINCKIVVDGNVLVSLSSNDSSQRGTSVLASTKLVLGLDEDALLKSTTCVEHQHFV